MNREYKLYLDDILISCNNIEKYVEYKTFDEFNNDDILKDAVVRRFEIIGEAVKNIPDYVRTKYSELNWKSLAGLRDKLIHGYFGVDYYLVWDTIKIDIPCIKLTVMKILDELK